MPVLSRDELISTYYPLARRIAICQARKLPGGTWRDDLIAAAMEAFVRSAGSWDDSTPVRFDFYLKRRIPGAVLDEWRRLTGVRGESDRKLPTSLQMTDPEDGSLLYDWPDPQESVEHIVETRDILRTVAAAVQTERERCVLVEHCYGDREGQSIAAQYHVGAGTISHDIARLRGVVRNYSRTERM